ncbi:MAG: response regulator transcription factor [Wenzhouxiangellaceae bacterium]|nr:response regulator transcription factor [Wenzhouxiangellaceae bacterium]
MKILVVDDDIDLRSLIGFALRRDGLLAVEAGSVDAARRAFIDETPDLVILDVNLPDGDGISLCRELRVSSRVPILMLTVRAAEDDLVEALEGGADDYLTKPFSPRTLMARVKALLRRAGEGGSPDLGPSGAPGLDLEMHRLSLPHRPALKLTALETRLMQILIAHQGRVVTTDKLIAHVWGPRRIADRQMLKQLVHRLRGKLEIDPGEPQLLRTEAGIGYRFVLD